jgi:uncharacterized protein (TIGR02284 family)
MDHDTVIDVLNRLIAICRDDEGLYRSAGEKLADLQSQALFMDIADKRSLSAAALADLVVTRGAEPVRRGPLTVDRRPYVAAQPVAISGDRAALVDQLRRAEERAIDEFSKALAQDLPMDARAVVDQHYQAIRRAYGRLVMLSSALS